VFFVHSWRKARSSDQHVRNVVTIHSSCDPNKLATLTLKCWANFILYCQQIDNEAKELNLKTRPAAFRLHLSDGWYVSVTGGYNCVDFRRFYIPYGTLHEHVRPTRDGISLRLDEWAVLLVVIPTIHERHPELAGVCPEAQSQLCG